MELVRPGCESAEVPAVAGAKLVVTVTKVKVRARVHLDPVSRAAKPAFRGGFPSLVPDRIDSTTAQSSLSLTLVSWRITSITAIWIPVR